MQLSSKFFSLKIALDWVSKLSGFSLNLSDLKLELGLSLLWLSTWTCLTWVARTFLTEAWGQEHDLGARQMALSREEGVGLCSGALYVVLH